MEKNISPAGMTCIVLVAVASVVGVSYASFAITRDSANEGNQEVVTQAEAATTSWTSTYNGKSVTGSQVVNLLNNADSRGISVFISTRGIERELTTQNSTPVLKHNGKYYVNYGTTYNYEDGSYGYVEGEANYTGDSALLQVRDGQSLKTNYSPKFDNSTIVKNKDFSAAYNVGSPTYIESTAKFDANLIYGPDGEVTGVILSQSTKSTAATTVQLGSSSGGGFVNGSGAMGGTSGSYIPTHSSSGNIPLASASNNGTVAGGTLNKVSSNSKPANNLKQETNYGVSDKLDINQEGAVKVDVSAIDETGLGFVAIKVSDETPTEKQLLTEQYMLYIKYDIPGMGSENNIAYIYDNFLQDNGDYLYYEDQWPFVVVNKNNANVMGLEIPEKGMYLLYPQNIKEMGGTFEYTIEKKQFVQFYLDGVPYKAFPDEDVDHWASSAYAPEGGYFDSKDMYHLNGKLFPDFKNGDYPVDGRNYMSMDTTSGDEYYLLDGSKQSIMVGNDGITLKSGSAILSYISSEYVTRNDNVITVSNSNTGYDGTYTIYEDGYIELNGNLIAKAKDKWVNMGENVYFIIHNGGVWISEDGNVPMEYFMSVEDIGNAVNTPFTWDSELEQEILAEYGYPFTRYEGTLKLTHVYDMLALQNISDSGWYFIGTQKYKYWGGSGKDSESDYALLSDIDWSSSKVNLKKETTASKVVNNKLVKLRGSDILDDATYVVAETNNYSYDGKATNSIFVCEDYPFAYEAGMTYREWINSSYSSNTVTANDYGYGVYVPEEDLDKQIPNGHHGNTIIFSREHTLVGSPTWRFDGFNYCDGNLNYMTWHLENDTVLYGNNDYEYIGLWYGDNNDFGDVMSYDVYNYHLNHNCSKTKLSSNSPYNFPLYTVYKAKSGINKVDISNYLKYIDGRAVLLSEKLRADYNITTSDMNVATIYKLGDYIIHADTSEYYLNWESLNVGGHSISTCEYGSSLEMGILFYDNGVWYEGFVDETPATKSVFYLNGEEQTFEEGMDFMMWFDSSYENLHLSISLGIDCIKIMSTGEKLTDAETGKPVKRSDYIESSKNYIWQ